MAAEGDQETGNADQGGDPEAEHPAQELGTDPLELGPELDAQSGDLGSHLGAKLGDLLAQLSPELVDRFYRDGPVPLVLGDPHPITRLASPSENETVWQKLTPLNSVHKFDAVKQTPGVRVLLETPGPNPDPVLVAGEFGRGRVLAFGADSTWLWQMHGFEKEHKRFWRQVILWLVRRDDLVRGDVWVKLEQRRFNPGSKVQITVHEKLKLGRPGLSTYAIDFRQEGPSTVVTTENRKMPPELAAKMQYDIDRWKRGDTDCNRVMPPVAAASPAPQQ